MDNDAQLKKAVLEELAWEPSVKAAHIGVTAKDGVVTLMGHVETYLEKSAAEKAARRVRDVKGVAEDIEVRLPFSVQRNDDDIAAAALSQLKWDTSVPSDAVRVKVEKGWVTLEGTVESRYQMIATRDAVRRLFGVVGLSNNITLKPRANPANISGDIAIALHRSWVDPKNVKVTAKDGVVTLTGTVDSWSDRNLAAETAWSAPGAINVKNDIRVN